MTVGQFEKAQKLHKQILLVIEEIEEIKKMANEIAKDKCEIKFGFEIVNATKKENVKKEFDDDPLNALIKATKNIACGSFSPGGFLFPVKTEKEDYINEYMFAITDSECLKILSILLKSKHDDRDKLIKAITKLGIQP